MFLLFVLLITSVVQAAQKEAPLTVFPKHTDLNLHLLYKNYLRKSDKCPKGEVWVQGPYITEAGIDCIGNEVSHLKTLITKLGLSFCLSEKIFDQERKWGESVFQTRVSSGSKNEGTSFLVGDNIILTNHHVAVPGPDGKDCKALEISFNKEPKEWIKCKKVLYCDKAKDICFVEINQAKNGKNLSEKVSKLKLNCHEVADQSAYVIGNSGKLGIQGSKGEVYSGRKDGMINHRIPLIGGASGAPLINEKGEVIGITHSHTIGRDFVSVDEGNYNYGTSMKWIKEKINQEVAVHALSISTNGREDMQDLLKIKQLFNNSPSCR